jgi:DNA-binding NtrC family response regulator
MKILLVESKREKLVLLRHTLSQHTVIHARNRAEASSFFIESRPDVVLVNKILNDTSGLGIGAAQDILNINSSARVIVYAEHGIISKEDEMHGIEMFIPEPLSRKKVSTSIETVFSLKHSMLLVPC